MKLLPTVGRIEPLENRIAPSGGILAKILIGGPASSPNPNASDTLYGTGSLFPDLRPAPDNKLHFVPTYDINDPTQARPNDPIAQAVDDPGVSNTYYLQLSKGDEVLAFNGQDAYTESLILVNSGHMIAFFTDLNGDGRFENGELTGIALGKNASVQLGGTVNGDIVTNLDEHGSNNPLLQTIDLGGLVSNTQGIKSLDEEGGSINGNILSGGNISKMIVSVTAGTTIASVNNVYAGSAADQQSYDFFQIPDPANPGHFLNRFTVDFTEPAGQKGASITNASIGSLGHTDTETVNNQLVSTWVPGVLAAGGGGAGAAGGNLTNISITGASNAFSLLAGHGGDAALGKTNGGAGGLIKGVYVTGVSISTANALDTIQAGDGGQGLSNGHGGAGGSETNVFVGYQLVGKTVTPSQNLSQSNLMVLAGAGGDGEKGGAGGALSNINARVSTPADLGGELTFSAGVGGDALSATGGGAGAGGSIKTIQALNEVKTSGSETIIEAGNAGTASGSATGAAGGSISAETVLGFNFETIAGDGSAGKKGGAGGSITGVDVTNGVGILNEFALLNAGFGGAGTAGNGGSGGNVSKVSVGIADYSSFLVNTGTQGNGGDSVGGKGGNGGSVSSFNVVDVDNDPENIADTFAGSLAVRGGDGGDGSKGGGTGGSLGGTSAATFVVTGFGLNMSALAGAGGSATVSGKGGNGGSAKDVQLTAQDNFELFNQNGLDVFGVIKGGAGGSGLGKGAGGSGGDVSFVNLNSDGDATLEAGDGGSGQASNGSSKATPAGHGGSVITSGAFANNGAGILMAGNAGLLGGAAAGGGLIGGKGVNTLDGLRAATDLTMVAGNGSNGGAGGNIINLTYGGATTLLQTPTPSGNITVQAGDGSASGKVAGAGGQITNLSGTVTTGPGKFTVIQAGNGGGSATASAAGGSVTNVTIAGGGAPEGLFTVAAGDAGDSGVGVNSSAKKGGVGGSVNGLQVSGLDGPEPFSGQIVTPGTAVTVQVESIDVSGLYNHPAGTFTLSFDGETTQSLPANATALDIQNALNSLATIAFPGGGTTLNGVTVTNGTTNGSFVITFINPGLLDAITGDVSPVSVFRSVAAGDGGNADTLAGKGGNGGSITGVSVDDHDIGVRSGAAFGYESAGGLFVGVGGVGKTAGVNGSVSQVHANAIAAIVAGRTATPQMAENVSHVYVNNNDVLLTQQSLVLPDSFALSFNGAQTANLPQGATAQQVQVALNALPSIASAGGVVVSYGSTAGSYMVIFNSNGLQVPIAGTETIPVTASETIAANTTTLNVGITTDGGQTLPVTITQPGAFPLDIGVVLPGSINFVSNTTVVGDPVAGLNQIETLDLTQLLTHPTGLFNLSFDGNTTPNLAASSTPTQIATALNALQSIIAVGGVTVAADTTPGVVDVTFIVPNTVDDITGVKILPQQEQVHLGAVANTSNGTFTVTFNGATTAALPASESASSLQTTLNALSTIKTAGGVTVAAVANTPGSFNVFFNNVGGQTPFTGAGNVSETQTLDFTSVQSSAATGNIALSFNGQTITTPVPIDATALQVQNALNGLSSVTAAGSVTVTQTSPHVFSLVFGHVGQEPGVGALAALPEVQTLDVSTVDHLATGSFNLTFNGKTTSVALPGNATAAQIAAALNGLTSVQQTGPGGANGSVTVTPTTPDHFAVTFNTPGHEPVITGAGAIAEQQEVQVYAPVGPATGDFVLTFNGQTTGTITGGSTAATVQAALNGLTSISTIGGVTVTPTTTVAANGASFVQAGSYTVAFNSPNVANGDLIVGAQIEPMVVTSPQAGNSSTVQIELVKVAPKGAFNPATFAQSDLVGAILNINAIDGNVFHYLTPATGATVQTGNFQVGDTPLDGIVMAHNLDQSTINFTPEAELTDKGFFDNNNQ